MRHCKDMAYRSQHPVPDVVPPESTAQPITEPHAETIAEPHADFVYEEEDAVLIGMLHADGPKSGIDFDIYEEPMTESEYNEDEDEDDDGTEFNFTAFDTLMGQAKEDTA